MMMIVIKSWLCTTCCPGEPAAGARKRGPEMGCNNSGPLRPLQQSGLRTQVEQTHTVERTPHTSRAGPGDVPRAFVHHHLGRSVSSISAQAHRGTAVWGYTVWDGVAGAAASFRAPPASGGKAGGTEARSGEPEADCSAGDAEEGRGAEGVAVRPAAKVRPVRPAAQDDVRTGNGRAPVAAKGRPIQQVDASPAQGRGSPGGQVGEEATGSRSASPVATDSCAQGLADSVAKAPPHGQPARGVRRQHFRGAASGMPCGIQGILHPVRRAEEPGGVRGV